MRLAFSVSFIAAVLGLVLPAQSGRAQMQRVVSNTKSSRVDAASPHYLSWWTIDPLRHDATGDLMIGFPADNGVRLTANSYSVRQSVKVLGTVNGSEVVQIVDLIRGKPGIRLYGANLSDGLTQWMSLLVRPPGDVRYSEIFQFQTSTSLFEPLSDVELYGSGAHTILGFYDPDTGNGGGCESAYWWFDRTGAHPVDFKLLEGAMHAAVGRRPVQIFYCCSAMHPAVSQIDAPVQLADAPCSACGYIGRVKATYMIRDGVAEPLKVTFVPSAPQ